MIIRYLYNGKEFKSETEVRKAVWEKERKVFGEVPTEGQTDFWNCLGVTIEESIRVVSESQKAEEKLLKAKKARNASMASVTVEVDGFTFDGDENSQERMSRYIQVMDEGDSVSWVLADNSVASVTREQLAKALKLSVMKQAEIWTVPYEVQ